jgi:hypothetical protein
MIKYGFAHFSTTRLYRISPIVDDKTIAGRTVWVKNLIKQFGLNWLVVTLADSETEYLVKPAFIIPD